MKIWINSHKTEPKNEDSNLKKKRPPVFEWTFQHMPVSQICYSLVRMSKLF